MDLERDLGLRGTSGGLGQRRRGVSSTRRTVSLRAEAQRTTRTHDTVGRPCQSPRRFALKGRTRRGPETGRVPAVGVLWWGRPGQELQSILHQGGTNPPKAGPCTDNLSIDDSPVRRGAKQFSLLVVSTGSQSFSPNARRPFPGACSFHCVEVSSGPLISPVRCVSRIARPCRRPDGSQSPSDQGNCLRGVVLLSEAEVTTVTLYRCEGDTENLGPQY